MSEVISRVRKVAGLVVEIRSDEMHFNVYRIGAEDKAPVAVIHRRRMYAAGPAFTARLVNVDGWEEGHDLVGMLMFRISCKLALVKRDAEIAAAVARYSDLAAETGDAFHIANAAETAEVLAYPAETLDIEAVEAGIAQCEALIAHASRGRNLGEDHRAHVDAFWPIRRLAGRMSDIARDYAEELMDLDYDATADASNRRDRVRAISAKRSAAFIRLAMAALSPDA